MISPTLITVLMFLVYKNIAQACETDSFKNIDLKVNYININWKNMQASECLSPTTTLQQNEHTGNVWEIRINKQVITVLDQQAIANFSDLAAIRLAENKITELNEGAFSNLPNLHYIDLSQNQIKSLEEQTFFKTQELSYLLLHNNRLQQFDQSWFENATQLTYLTLAHNFIARIPKKSFTSLPELKHLDLSHNLIVDIHENAFHKLFDLEYLDLSYNRIGYLDDDFYLPPDLKTINLFHNNISYLSYEAFESIAHVQYLIMLFNPLSCECYDRIIGWINDTTTNIENKMLRCENVDISNIPLCVTTTDTECVTNIEDLYSVLHSTNVEYDCYCPPRYLEKEYNLSDEDE